MARLNLENTPYKVKGRAVERGHGKIPGSISFSDSESEPRTAPVQKKGRRLIRGVRKIRRDESGEDDEGSNGTGSDNDGMAGNTKLMKRMAGGDELNSRFSDLSLLPPPAGGERGKREAPKRTTQHNNTAFQIKSQTSRKQHDTNHQDTLENESLSSENEEFDSLDEFIVGDDEIISTYGDTDGEVEVEVEDVEPELFTKTPRRSPRKLFRGRTPRMNRRGEDSVGSFTSSNTVKSRSPSPLFDRSPGQQDGDERAYSPESDTGPQPSDKTDDKMEPFDNAPSLLSKPSPDPSRPVTPPGSPSKPRLKSPTKSTKKIPPSPHKPSLDSFWDQGETNTWNDKFSPRKTPMLGKLDFRIFEDDDDDDNDNDDSEALEPFNISPIRPPLTVSSKNTKASKERLNAEASARREQAARKREFDQKKDQLANDFLKELDDLVTGGEIQRLARSTGGVKITWNKKLATTAGRANWKREVRTSKTVDSNSSSSSSSSSSSRSSSTAPPSPSSKLASLSLSSTSRPVRHHAGIELAEKIIDSEDRLLNTLAHEYCHLTNFMISNVRDQPHGTSFKNWAAKCMHALAAHSTYGKKVKITTKHSYVINYKYCWGCQGCGQQYGRHSKSIDPAKVRCGKCKDGKLLQIKPKPRNVKKDSRKPVPQRRAFGVSASGGDLR